MIKLNNKNITYVALADSNNSIKAPKEIWYADSNNSVKLVYRRKDALIEGEDYEKYHWLVSNSEDNQTPYIDTLIPPDLNQNIAFSFKVIDSNTNGGEPGVWGAILSTSWSRCVIRCFKHKSYDYIILEYNNDNKDFPQKENMLIKTDFSEGKEYDCSLSINSSTTALGVINNESKELVANSNVSFVLNPQPTHKLFVEYNNSTWSFVSVGFKKFSITNLISLIPCKLLKPVPKWLDANGIRRQVGECGMIDLVSGKFYGNVNSNGTFTVENYYERKEWLIGDGSAYIDTDIIVNVTTLRYSLKFVHDANNIAFMCGSRHSNTHEGDSTALAFDDIHNDKIRLDAISSLGLLYSDIMLNEPNEVLIDCQTNSAIVNNSSIAGNRTKFNNSPYTFRIFDACPKNTTTNTCTCKLSYFTLNDSTHSLNLIPCTLTMDLPASMDANGISRTKGTSGMWDLVSDRFYGNVANSGTFKAVNLAEGVDYEVHQWLVVSVNEGATLPAIGAYITLPTPMSLDNKVFTITMGSVYRDLVIYGSVVDGLQYIIVIYTYSSGSTTIQERHGNTNIIHSINGTLSGLKSVTLDFKNKVATVGNNSFNIDGVGYQFMGTNATTWDRTKTIGNITIDNELNLIPVKLLKSIPSKYDANGIARQAGECGMYDTVNDVFFGNVANRGTFSVSD